MKKQTVIIVIVALLLLTIMAIGFSASAQRPAEVAIGLPTSTPEPGFPGFPTPGPCEQCEVCRTIPCYEFCMECCGWYFVGNEWTCCAPIQVFATPYYPGLIPMPTRDNRW